MQKPQPIPRFYRPPNKRVIASEFDHDVDVGMLGILGIGNYNEDSHKLFESIDFDKHKLINDSGIWIKILKIVGVDITTTDANGVTKLTRAPRGGIGIIPKAPRRSGSKRGAIPEGDIIPKTPEEVEKSMKFSINNGDRLPLSSKKQRHSSQQRRNDSLEEDDSPITRDDHHSSSSTTHARERYNHGKSSFDDNRTKKDDDIILKSITGAKSVDGGIDFSILRQMKSKPSSKSSSSENDTKEEEKYPSSRNDDDDDNDIEKEKREEKKDKKHHKKQSSSSPLSSVSSSDDESDSDNEHYRRRKNRSGDHGDDENGHTFSHSSAQQYHSNHPNHRIQGRQLPQSSMSLLRSSQNHHHQNGVTHFGGQSLNAYSSNGNDFNAVDQQSLNVLNREFEKKMKNIRLKYDHLVKAAKSSGVIFNELTEEEMDHADISIFVNEIETLEKLVQREEGAKFYRSGMEGVSSCIGMLNDCTVGLPLVHGDEIVALEEDEVIKERNKQVAKYYSSYYTESMEPMLKYRFAFDPYFGHKEAFFHIAKGIFFATADRIVKVCTGDKGNDMASSTMSTYSTISSEEDRPLSQTTAYKQPARSAVMEHVKQPTTNDTTARHQKSHGSNAQSSHNANSNIATSLPHGDDQKDGNNAMSSSSIASSHDKNLNHSKNSTLHSSSSSTNGTSSKTKSVSSGGRSRIAALAASGTK